MDILTPDSINFAHYLDDSDAQERVRPAVDFFEDTLEALIPPAGGRKNDPCAGF